MKTSTKLLFSFIGLLVLLMLVSNLVLWANFKRGYNGDGPLGAEHQRRTQTKNLQPFRVLKVVGNADCYLTISKGSDALEYDSVNHAKFAFTQQGDTLLMGANGNTGLHLTVSSLQMIIISGVRLTIDGLDQPLLNIQAGDSCAVHFQNLNTGRLSFIGGVRNEFTIYADSRVDSLELQLGKESDLVLNDVGLKYTDLKVDSLNRMEIEGKSMRMVKQIK